MRISDWSSDVCSSDLILVVRPTGLLGHPEAAGHKAEAGLTQVVLPAGPHYQLFVAAVLAALAAAPLVVDDFLLVLLVDLLVLAPFAARLPFLLSIAGPVHFGHAAFHGNRKSAGKGQRGA